MPGHPLVHMLSPGSYLLNGRAARWRPARTADKRHGCQHELIYMATASLIVRSPSTH